MNLLSKVANIFTKTKSAPLMQRNQFFNSYDINASWMPFSNIANYVHAYLTLPEVYMPIDKQAGSFNRFMPKIINEKTGDEIPNHPFLQFINQPNPIQSASEFFYQLYSSLKIAGFAVLKKGAMPAGYTRNSLLINPLDNGLYLIPPEILNYRCKNNIDFGSVTGYSDLFNEFYYQWGQRYNINFEDIIIISKVGFGSIINFFVGDSPFTRLKYPISNLYKIYEGDNVILDRLGALGVFTGVGGGEYAGMPMDDLDKNTLELGFSNYGIKASQKQFIVTNHPLQYQNTTPNIQSLQFIEKTAAYRDTICNVLGTPPILFSFDKSTFNNQSSAIKQMYQDTIIPTAGIITDAISKAFLYGEKLVFDYSDVEALQGDEKLKSETNKVKTDTIVILNKSVATGEMSYENAVSFAIEILGVPTATAKKIITKNKIQNEPKSAGQNIAL